MTNERTSVRARDGSAVAGYALGFGLVVAALAIVFFDLAAPGLPWILSALGGLVVGGGVGAGIARARGVEI